MQMTTSVAKRLLNLKEAATYCGMPARNFKKHMPIQPVRLGPHELWDIRSLDAFIDGLQGARAPARRDWSEAVSKL
jgi:hypothetical protein